MAEGDKFRAAETLGDGTGVAWEGTARPAGGPGRAAEEVALAVILSTSFWMSTAPSSSSSVGGGAAEVIEPRPSGITSAADAASTGGWLASGWSAADAAVERAPEEPCADDTEDLRAKPLAVGSAGGGGGERTDVGAGGDWLFNVSGAEELFMDSAALDTSGWASLASL